jgi:uncharacterized membrane protein
MTTKFISLATGIVTLDVYLQSQLHSNDPLFLLVSNNLAVNMLMVVLAAVAISVSFRKRFSSWYSFAATAALAAIFLTVGAAGILFSGFTYSLWMVFLPLNYMMLISFGTVLGICALSYQHAPRPESARWPLPVLPARLASPMPKISHSPLSSLPRRPQPA